MPGRYLREESPTGLISFEEYQSLTRAISQKKGKPFERSDALALPLEAANALDARRGVVQGGSLWTRLLEEKTTLTTPLVAEKRDYKDHASVTFTRLGFALIKSVERNAIGLGLGDHTASADNFREALLAELIVRFGKVNSTGKRIIADIPLPSLRWWLGISGKYPYLKNIRMSIINKQNSPLNIEEVADSASNKSITLMCLPLENPGTRQGIIERNHPAALELSKNSGEPLAAAISLLEDAQVLRPDLTVAEVVSLCTQLH